MSENLFFSTSEALTRVFEGPEKLLEIWFGPTPESIPEISSKFDNDLSPRSGLRLVERDVWDEMLDIVKCHVLNVVHNDYLDAYLLSESSMFIYPHKIILKTCGTTTLLIAIPRLLEIASEYCQLNKVWRVFYSRKSFVFPEAQLGPHKDWNEEVKYLDQLLENGAAYTVGKSNGDHCWFLWLNSPKDDPEPPCQESTCPLDETNSLLNDFQDITIEILMTELSSETLNKFYYHPSEGNSGTEGGARVDQKTGLRNIYPEAQLDSYLYEPCGYSANGLLKDNYFNIHVTPEHNCSYASFETNIPVPVGHGTITDVINKVIAIFEPGKFSVTVFKTREDKENKISLVASVDAINEYSRKDRILYEFEVYDLIFAHFEKNKTNKQ
ncbi:S-adenosylmethionine decarboxylase [Glomus cerebriforme]|uniref:S-adenosylmethionine decarboxylase proenzyme n=1 Tax=Glomus cerebriforme TaxID=658196 RepID=A0A397SL22_9GLOM|nr:S-adenosylmethionine decarboxylase [Glomus cerebriforme]